MAFQQQWPPFTIHLTLAQSTTACAWKSSKQQSRHWQTHTKPYIHSNRQIHGDPCVQNNVPKKKATAFVYILRRMQSTFIWSLSHVCVAACFYLSLSLIMIRTYINFTSSFFTLIHKWSLNLTICCWNTLKVKVFAILFIVAWHFFCSFLSFSIYCYSGGSK